MVSSQEMVPMSSQESQEVTMSQGTAPASSQEMTSASQESMSQDMASMPSQNSTTDAMILNATGGIPMEDETCLEEPTLKCTPEEERSLLNPLLTGSLNQLEDVLLGYLNVLVAHINEIRKVKVSQMPVPSPRVPPGLPPPQPAPCHWSPALQHLLVRPFTQPPATWEPQFPAKTRGCPHIH